MSRARWWNGDKNPDAPPLRNRWFADSLLEGGGFEPSVPLLRPVAGWLKKAPELCAHGQPRCVRTREMRGGAAILTIGWLDGDRCHARTLYRNHARRE